MKKAGKFLAYLLVLTMLTSLLMGLGYKNESVKADDVTRTFNVLEIVPDTSMATFGYFVAGQEPTINGKSCALNYAGDGDMRAYLQAQGLCESGSDYVSTNYFVEKILKRAYPSVDNWTVTVTTQTPATLTESAINSADMIVINQTVPAALKITGVNSSKKFSDFTNDTFSWDMALKLVKKIAGVDSPAVPYLIDQSIYNTYYNSVFVDTRTHNGNSANATYGYIAADQYTLHKEDPGDTTKLDQNGDKNGGPNWGTDQNFYKVFKLVASTNPSTVYGLYLTKNNDGSYGINARNGKMIAVGDAREGLVRPYFLNCEYAFWPDELFNPYYLTKSPSGISGVMSTMDWINHKSYATSNADNFYRLIGAGESGNGAGILYRYSSDSYFKVMEAGAEALEEATATPTDEPEITDAPDIVIDKTKFKLEVTVGNDNYYDNTHHYDVKFKVTNGTSDTVKNWYIKVPGIEFDITDYQKKFNVSSYEGGMLIEPEDANSYVMTTIGAGVAKDEFQENIYGSSTTIATKTAIEQAFANYEVYAHPETAEPSSTETPAAGGAIGDKLCLIIRSFLSKDRADCHPYRVLIVSDTGIDGTINRSVVADMVKAANNADRGLAGGIWVESVSKYYLEGIYEKLNESYDIIFVIASTSLGNDKLSGYNKGIILRKDDGKNKNSIVSSFKSLWNSSSTFGIQYLKTPVEYYSNFVPKYTDQNGLGDWIGKGSMTIPGYPNYINSSAHPQKTLDFDIKVKGSSSYKVEVYVDKNGDLLFEESEKKSIPETSTGSKRFTKNLSVDDVLVKDFVGGFTWKLVITDTSNNKSISKIGFSAVRNTEDKKTTIKILQIYPTDYGYAVGSKKFYSFPLLVMPTKREMESAESHHINISNYETGTYNSDNAGNDLDGLLAHFSGELSVDVISVDTLDVNTDAEFDSITSDKVVSTKLTLDGDKNKKILWNTAYFTYFLSKLSDFDIDVVKYSVYGFNKAVKNGDIVYNAKTGRLALKNGAGSTVNNLDGSPRYVYSASDLGLADNWRDQKVTWADGQHNKYLVDDITGKIYGYRGTTAAVYYSDTQNGKTGQLVKEPSNNDDFDLVMLGFGTNMDYMTTDAVAFLEKYLDNKGPAFIGNGAVTLSDNNSLGAMLRSKIGMSTTRTGETDFTAQSPIVTMMRSNDTLFSHFPYVVPRYSTVTQGCKQPYQLAFANDEIVVAYSKYATGAGEKYGEWGHAKENYYLYKYGNITFCGFGDPYGNADFDQLGSIMTMGENVMLVNALVTTARSGADGISDDPRIKCIDPDGSIVEKQIGDAEDDEKGSGSTSKKLYIDAVYTDFDSFEMAKQNNSGFGVETSNEIVISALLKPVGFPDDTPNIRWIPYQSRASVEGSTIVFLTPDDKPLSLLVYRLKDDGTYENLTAGGAVNSLDIGNKKVYYIGIPIDNTDPTYTGAGSSNKLGFKLDPSATGDDTDQFSIKISVRTAGSGGTTKEVELHTIEMYKRLLYPVK